MPDEPATEESAVTEGQEPNGQQEQGKPKPPPKPQTLEELLADLDDDRRKVILEQVSKPRTEAKNLRERLKLLEPKAAQFDRLDAASKTAEQVAQEALTAANERFAAANQRMARAEVKAALAGVVDDPDSIVDDLNLSRFVDDDGEIDADAIGQLRTKYAGFAARKTAATSPRPDTSQASGANGRTAATPQEEFGAFLKTQLSGRT